MTVAQFQNSSRRLPRLVESSPPQKFRFRIWVTQSLVQQRFWWGFMTAHSRGWKPSHSVPPPAPCPLPLAVFVWEPFNCKEYSVSFAKDDELFMSDGNNGICATTPSSSVTSCMPTSLKVLYFSTGAMQTPNVSRAPWFCCWRASAHLTIVCQTQICSDANLAWSFMQRGILRFGCFHLSNLSRVSVLWILCGIGWPSQRVGTPWTLAFQA